MKLMELRVTVNGRPREWTIAPGDLLLDVLRREGLFGVKRGCERGECGSCTVLVNGRAVNSCLMFAAKVEDCEVLTIEGMAQGDQLSALQKSFLDHGAVQCGYCSPGMVLSAKALLDRNPHPSEAEVREALSGVLCRCTGYVKPVQAVLAVANQAETPAPRKRVPAEVVR
jgi:aerobic-type carbon monoxide dehydrogenase small subunit (CoxS/CutS family)